MNQSIAISATALALVMLAGAIRAHHAGRMYDTTPAWISGTVIVEAA